MSDVAADPANAALVARLDAKLRAELGDYDAIDLEVMRNDKHIFDTYFVQAMTADQLRKKFEQSFHGFDDADMEKVHQWMNTSI